MPRKAIVMAGGKATRLQPLSTAINKHVLPVGGKPMIHWVVDTLVRGGIRDMLIILNNNHAQQVMEVLEDGERFGCAITYAYQREPVGLTKHLQAGRSFVGTKDFVLMLGDSLYLTDLNFQEMGGPHLWAMPTGDLDDVSKYAQLDIVGHRVIGMIEKSSEKQYDFLMTGAWTLPPDAFDRAEELFRNSTTEVQLRTLVHEYIKEDDMMATILPPNSFLDLGTHEALQKGAALVQSRQ